MSATYLGVALLVGGDVGDGVQEVAVCLAVLLVL